jgi:3-deoxy-7-phosphoheptulonate synthase
VSHATSRGRTVIKVRGVAIGGGELVIMAGPASVESKEQILACAREVKERGGRILRGGCFRARSSSGSFRGLGVEGLELLSEAGRHYDLPVVTEITRPEDIETVARFADILQIGARNMHDDELLRAVGKRNRPVLLKRGMMATLEEFLEAAESIAQAGNSQVILCERGVRTFETMARNTLDLGAIPILRELTHLPIIVDPSRAAGRRDLVAPLAMAALALRPDGLMVQIHPDPDHAMSDGFQALAFPDFAELMGRIYAASART